MKIDDLKEKLEQLLVRIRLKEGLGQDWKDEADTFSQITVGNELLRSMVISMPSTEKKPSLPDILLYVLQNIDKVSQDAQKVTKSNSVAEVNTNNYHLPLSSDVVDVNGSGIIRQSNELVEANYKLSIEEQKVMLNVCTQIDPTKDHFERIKISAKSLMEVCGFKNNGYRELKNIAKKLLSRVIILRERGSKDWYGTHWVQACEYVTGKDGQESYMLFELDPRLCPQFLQLKERFLKMNISSIVSFSHVYSTRFYMIFLNRLKIGHMRVSFERIRDLLDLGKNYTAKNMKARVIKPAMDEINEASSLEVTYSYYTEGGRKQVGVDFYFRAKKGTALLKEAKAPKKKKENNFDELDTRVYSRLVKIGKIDPEIVAELIKTYGSECCRQNFEAQLKKGTAKNLAGLVIRAIQEDWEGKRQQAEAEVKTKEKAAYQRKYRILEDPKEKEKTAKPKKLPHTVVEYVRQHGKADGVIAMTLKQYGVSAEDILLGNYKE